ncbi:DUF1294 domain-containing protein [Marinobacterium jannaschii]|uniref:DUF1294 domain-containing protein n=1 Tax=Marinobacterium jannaschii TaxID=64970 RepID=UPI0006841683|nr:DUF1294 domain-containing protein [Marinobacterium jannaschii]
MRNKGKVASWNDDKGFGFIEPCLGGKNVFLHIKAFDQRGRRPEVGNFVNYSLAADKQGRPCAAKVSYDGERKMKAKSGRSSALPMVAIVFLGIIGLSAWMQKIPMLLAALYVVASLITFLTYASDKSAARQGRWRTPESTLHLLALIGGWPGAVFAQQILRHKSSKRSFKVVFWLTLLLNCTVFLWLLSESGAPVKALLVRLTETGLALL